jgi:hypothetical protein
LPELHLTVQFGEMDLAVYARVLAASKWTIVAGLVLAAVLAVVAMAKPVVDSEGIPTLVYRKSELWQAQTTVLLTQRGFPEGRSTFPSLATPKQPPFADPGRFYGLADLYAQFVSGDEVMARLRAKGPLNGSVAAATIPSSTGNATPLIAIFGKADTPAKAATLAKRATSAFVSYIDERQNRAKIPVSQRVEVQKITSPGAPTLLEPRSKTLPIMVFLAIFSATIAIAFIRANVASRARPMPAPVPGHEQELEQEHAASAGPFVQRVQPRRKTQTLR